MNIKVFRIFFIITIIMLVAISIYIIYIKDAGKMENIQDDVMKVKISKEINMGITEFDTLNPILTKSLEIQQIDKLMYEPLINVTEDFNVEQSIAKEWSRLDDLTYIIKLDENIKWKDESNVTVEDILFTIEKIKESDSIYKENVQPITNIEKIDNTTLKIYISEPNEFFEYLLCFPIVKKSTYNEEIPEGIGQYKITDFQKNKIEIEGDEIKIIVSLYETITELYNAFTRGMIDFIITQNTNYEKYIGNVGFEESIITGREFYYIECDKIKNIGMRKFLNNNINREKIIYNLYNKKYVTADFPLAYGSFLNKENTNGKTENKCSSQNISLSSNNENKEIAYEIKEQLEEKGVKVNVVNNVMNADLILTKRTVSINPEISYYFKNEKDKIKRVEQIENKEVLKEEYRKIINEYYEELPFISLYFNSYIILHSNKLKGNFSGNWYNMFYHINTWYKEI